MKTNRLILSILIYILFTVYQVSAHPGKLDSKGGHTKKEDGTYHYHNSKDRTIEYDKPQNQLITENLEETSTKHQYDIQIIKIYEVNNTRIKLDDDYIDILPIIVDGRSLLPVRDLVELLEGSVEWDEKTNQITILKDDKIIVLKIGDKTAYLNDEIIEIDVPPQIIEQKTMVPLRFIATSLHIEVDYVDNIIVLSNNSKKQPSIIQTSKPILVKNHFENENSIENNIRNNTKIVYWGNTGNKVHIDSNCRTIKNGIIKGTLAQAKEAGHDGWCGICSKGMTDEKFLKNF